MKFTDKKLPFVDIYARMVFFIVKLHHQRDTENKTLKKRRINI